MPRDAFRTKISRSDLRMELHAHAFHSCQEVEFLYRLEFDDGAWRVYASPSYESRRPLGGSAEMEMETELERLQHPDTSALAGLSRVYHAHPRLEQNWDVLWKQLMAHGTTPWPSEGDHLGFCHRVG